MGDTQGREFYLYTNSLNFHDESRTNPKLQSYSLWKCFQKDPGNHETTKKRIRIVFTTEQTETSLIEKIPIVEDPDDDIIRAPVIR